MAVATVSATPVTAPNGVLLLPERPPRLGPISRRLVTRLVLSLATVVAVGSMLVAFGGSALRAAGLSMVFPGAGLLYAASPVAFLIVAVLVVLAVVLWWGISAHWGIPLVWFGSVIASAVIAPGPRLWVDRGTTWGWAIPIAYLLAAAAVATAVMRFEKKYRRKLARVPELNSYLAGVTPAHRERIAIEPDDLDAELLRWVYSMALQPLDEFKGFDWGEQIHGPTCARYQLNMLGYSLSTYAANWLPNAPQPVEQALANLIDKATDLRVWAYWRTLNLIGNFDANPDPIERDNIMLSAYLGDQINLYEAATGSARFDEPGSLTFVWKDGRTFAYDHHTIAEAVRRNFEANQLGFFPCEPGWVFTACNAMGAQALKGHDTLHGSSHWPAVESRWRHAVEQEMLTPDGNLPHIKSKLVGLSFDTGEVPGGEYFLTGTNSFADIAPDIAARGGLLGLRGVEDQMNALRTKIVGGVLEHDVTPAPERNTLITTAVPQWTKLVGAARAVGAHDVANAALAKMQATCATGERWPARPIHAGVQSIGIHLLVRWGSPLNTAGLALRGYRPPVGPVLRSADSSHVLVTKAVSPDGRALDLVVRSLDGPTTTRFGFDSLIPGAEYDVLVDTGVQRLAADASGAATFELTLDGPTRLLLQPASAPT